MECSSSVENRVKDLSDWRNFDFHKICVSSKVRTCSSSEVGQVIEMKEKVAIVSFGDEKRELELSELLPVWKCDKCEKSELFWRLGFPCNRGHVPVDMEGTVKDFLCKQSGSREDRCIGLIIASLCGDALGSPVEGHDKIGIARNYGPEGVVNFCPGTQMGVRHLGFRFGMYTDDGNSALALLSCLVESNGVLDSEKIALKYSEFYFHEPQRGYPGKSFFDK